LQELQIKPYLSKQIESEEQYHKELSPYVAGLLLALLNGINGGVTSIVQLRNIAENYKLRNSAQLQLINQKNAREIIDIANYAIGKVNSSGVLDIANINQVTKLAKEMDVLVDNLLNATTNRIYGLIPVGLGIGWLAAMFTDENTKTELFDRSNSACMGYVRSTYTQGVFNTMINTAAQFGYTEYAADNKHDLRVRPLHAKYFVPTNWIKFTSPPPCGHVGTEKNCRCVIVAVR
jgi:hypothetical protein